MLLAFISSAMPSRSNIRATCAPAALAGSTATDLAASSAAFILSAVPMSGFGAPARTATPKPARAMVTSGPGANVALAAASA